MRDVKLGILISGRGSNMTAIIEAIEAGQLDASVAVVISNKPDAAGLKVAQSYGLMTIGIDPKDFASKDDYEQQIVRVLTAQQVDVVVLAGYMKILGQPVLAAYPNRVINIHPSLLPDFKGLHAQRQALEAGRAEAGCTVHYVVPEVDSGAIIQQALVPVLSDDTEETLSQRILVEEHKLYPAALASVIAQVKEEQK